MDEMPNFPENNINNIDNNNNNLKIKEEPEEEEDEYSDNINDEEEEDDENEEKNEQNEDDSLSLDIDEDRYTLVQIREFLKKKRLKTEKKSLIPKKLNSVQNITYDANTNSLRNCFIPDISQLRDFLNHCVVKEIKEDESSFNIKEQTENVFDPQEFMLNNGIIKAALSVEDLSLVKKKNKVEKIPEIIEEKRKPKLKEPKMKDNEIIPPSIYTSKDKGNKEKFKEQFTIIRKIMSTDVLNFEQKNWLSNFIKSTNELPLETIIDQKKKFEIVFDLDNTCIFSYICYGGKAEGNLIQSKYSFKNIKLFEFSFANKYMYSILIIRQGLKEFVEYVKPIANFHISTLAAKSYGEEIVKVLEELFNIKFENFSSRDNNDVKKSHKYLEDLNTEEKKLPESTTIIFDDMVNVWEKETFNVIPSKKFYDKEIQMTQTNKKKDVMKTDLDIFIESYSPFNYNQFKEKEPSWRNQSIKYKEKCPFFLFKNKTAKNYNESYTAEYFDSPKYQFIYMKNVIKVLYCLVFYNDLEISDAIKLVRLNALNGKKFYLKYLTEEKINILRDIIVVCGGEVYFPPIGDDYTVLDLTQKIFLVVAKGQYKQLKEEINEELKEHKNYIMINEKFILDSYYFMTDLGESYKDKEYTNFDEE